jgi:regulator of chromosome condensation
MEPALIEGLDDVNIVKLACGDSISIALSSDGKVYSWGSFRVSNKRAHAFNFFFCDLTNVSRQADDGILGFSKDQKVQSKPVLFSALEKFKVVDIAAGADHAMALTDEGHVYSWGDGKQFQLGRRIMERRKTNGLVPERLALRNIVHIASGSYHSFALNDKNELYVWGCNNFKQTGLSEEYGGRAPDVIESPTQLETFTNDLIVKRVDAGEHHSVVLLTNGNVYTFGRADSSQLGLVSANIPINLCIAI